MSRAQLLAFLSAQDRGAARAARRIFSRRFSSSNCCVSMSEHHRAIRASLWGFVAGGVAGFALGILLAPDEGRQVRQRLAYLLERWSGQLAGVVEALGSESIPSAARQSANAVVADARQQAEQLLGEAEALMKEARSRRTGGPPPSLRRAS
jgi:gas vesicle protein